MRSNEARRDSDGEVEVGSGGGSTTAYLSIMANPFLSCLVRPTSVNMGVRRGREGGKGRSML